MSEASWTRAAASKLEGRTITSVRYADDAEREAIGFHYRPILLILDDGSIIYPSRDDEGNDAGALFTTYEDLQTIPVMR